MVVMNYIDMVLVFLTSNTGIITMLMSFLFWVSKRISTIKSVPIISAVQVFFDTAAQILEGLGAVCQQIANFLANVLRSDGYLGLK